MLNVLKRILKNIITQNFLCFKSHLHLFHSTVSFRAKFKKQNELEMLFNTEDVNFFNGTIKSLPVEYHFFLTAS